MPDCGHSEFFFYKSLVKFIAHKLKIIGEYCFHENNYKIKEIELPDVISIGACAFYQTSISALNLPKCTSIGREAFYECVFLSFVSLPAVTSIATNAFFECPLTKMYLGKNPPSFSLA